MLISCRFLSGLIDCAIRHYALIFRCIQEIETFAVHKSLDREVVRRLLLPCEGANPAGSTSSAGGSFGFIERSHGAPLFLRGLKVQSLKLAHENSIVL